MQYQDLSYGRVGTPDKSWQYVFPALRYVGWLDAHADYARGNVSEEATKKLKELLFLDLKKAEDKKTGSFNEQEAVHVHQRYRRGKPKPCPVCRAVVAVQPDNLSLYGGSSEKVLGRNELCLPSLKKDEFYTSPTLIYHYVVEHNYRPPQEYLDALNAFNLRVPFDANEAQRHLRGLPVPTHEVDEIDLTSMPPEKYLPNSKHFPGS